MLSRLSYIHIGRPHWHLRPILWGALCLISLAAVCTLFVLQIKIVAFKTTTDTTALAREIVSSSTRVFPLGVNPKTKTVTENPQINAYVEKFVASNYTPTNVVNSWQTRFLAHFAQLDWFQNLASPISRILVIQSGERSEEVVSHFTKILSWDTAEQTEFLTRIASEVPELPDGKLYPGTYIVEKDASPEAVAIAVADRFNAEVRSRYSDDVENVLPLRDALIIASLIEREAYDFQDMRYISGVIWNRLFIDMRLQIDATMQYAKATNQKSTTLKNWWPVPVPADKTINSPYNTYKIAGLPPGPISNPSIDAIIAALNPRETDCLFYFHDENGGFHCSVTYEEHVANLKAVFGQGK